ncbi:MAG: holo-ACP synthase [Bacteroidales bacterium]|nr:holo-ACP synthase [Bacteroidales bacterium]
MIFGIGTDIIEISRIEQAISRSQSFCEKIFTKVEQEYCNARNHARFESYAARYAAKEALFKALGTGYRYGFAFSEVEVLNDELGKPEIQAHGKVLKYLQENNITHIHLSLSHAKDNAVAYVILEK